MRIIKIGTQCVHVSAQCTVVGEINKEVEECNTSESLINLIIKYGGQMEHLFGYSHPNTGIDQSEHA